MKLWYAAIDEEGEILGLEATSEEAAALAVDMVGGTVMVQDLDPLQDNAIPAADMPAVAMRGCRIPRIAWDDVAHMDIVESWDLLHPYFEGLIKRGVETRRYDTPTSMSQSWIGQNYKTKKEIRGQRAKVMGVTLVPASHPRLAAGGEGPYSYLRRLDDAKKRAAGLHMIGRWKRELSTVSSGDRVNFCVGSSRNCRDSCLVFTGQNASEAYNSYRKIAQSMALLNQPVAFMRMLVDSLERWLRSKEIATRQYKPYVRLNVLSDIPWEEIAPWLFEEEFPGLSFYDYTKVPGRVTPTNYDLTFSFSGENANIDYAEQEILQGRRIAVVFLGHKPKGTKWREIRQKGKKLLKGVPLPESFWGLPVVDGDKSDVRPLDPAPSCVGLRWKTPSGKRSGVGSYELQGFSFVVPVYVISTRKPSLYRRTPAGLDIEGWGGEEPDINPDDDDEQWIVAPVTPRFQPIEHDVSQVYDF